MPSIADPVYPELTTPAATDRLVAYRPSSTDPANFLEAGKLPVSVAQAAADAVVLASASADATEKADAVLAASLQKSANLSDLVSPSAARTALGLTSAALGEAEGLTSGTLQVARLPALTGGDATTTAGSGSITLAATGVAASTYRSVTVDAKGRVTAGTNPTTLAGYGITDADAEDLSNLARSRIGIPNGKPLYFCFAGGSLFAEDGVNGPTGCMPAQLVRNYPLLANVDYHNVAVSGMSAATLDTNFATLVPTPPVGVASYFFLQVGTNDIAGSTAAAVYAWKHSIVSKATTVGYTYVILYTIPVATAWSAAGNATEITRKAERVLCLRNTAEADIVIDNDELFSIPASRRRTAAPCSRQMGRTSL